MITLFGMIPEMIENAIARFWHRPENYKKERWQFFKRWLTVLLSLAALCAGLIVWRVELSEWKLITVGGSLLIIAMALIKACPDKRDKIIRMERWWQGEGSKWSLLRF